MTEQTTVVNKKVVEKKEGILSERDPNTLTVYGCGGTGANIVRKYFKFTNHQSEVFSNIVPVVIDASDSDVTNDIPSEYLYIVKDDSGEQLEGGGKVKRTNYEPIKKSVKDMLIKYPPSEFNLVIHSNSGASGAVIGPSLVHELMSRGEQVIVLMVGSVSSYLEIKNNLGTILSYENMSTNVLKKPIVSVYMENSDETPKDKIDNDLRTFIGTIAIMASGKNKKLDRTDVTNFLDWTKVVNFTPSLTHLEIHGTNIVIPDNETLIGVLTLTDEDRSHEVDVPKYYQAVGILPDSNLDNVNSGLPMHFCTTIGHFNSIVDRMNKLLSKFETNKAATITRSFLSEADVGKADDNGMIL